MQLSAFCARVQSVEHRAQKSIIWASEFSEPVMGIRNCTYVCTNLTEPGSDAPCHVFDRGRVFPIDTDQ